MAFSCFYNITLTEILQEYQCLKEELGLFVLWDWQPNRRLLAMCPQLGADQPTISRLCHRVRGGRFYVVTDSSNDNAVNPQARHS